MIICGKSLTLTVKSKNKNKIKNNNQKKNIRNNETLPQAHYCEDSLFHQLTPNSDELPLNSLDLFVALANKWKFSFAFASILLQISRLSHASERHKTFTDSGGLISSPGYQNINVMSSSPAMFSIFACIPEQNTEIRFPLLKRAHLVLSIVGNITICVFMGHALGQLQTRSPHST